MLVRLSLLVRLLSVSSVVVPVVAYPSLSFAQDEEEEGEGEGEGEGEEGEEGEAEDKDQPKVTAGGLYTIDTYPLSEAERPLTLTQGVFEGRVGLNFDLSKDVTFDTWWLDVPLRYGLKDHIELEAGAERITIVQPEGLVGGHSFYVGGEIAIVYDVVDFRALAIIALPQHIDGAEGPGADAEFDLAFGFPFRFNFKDKFAIIALEKLFTIHTGQTTAFCGEGETECGKKPDLNIAVRGIFQATPNVALIAAIEVQFIQFEQDLMTVPASIAVQFTPNSRIDIGLQFTLTNLKTTELPDPNDPMGTIESSPIDGRALRLFGVIRI